jgi:two-component system OmpR family response regulator
MRILVVEDEPKLADVVAKGLTAKGYAVDVINDGEEALTRILVHGGDYDLIVLDLMLPGKSGREICEEVRAHDVTVPILILTARSETEHKVDLLLAGADDYLVKPFSFDELTARIQAILRRPTEAVPTVLHASDIELNPAEHTVTRGGKEVPLTLKEFRLLEYFMRHPNQVINREDFLTHLWDFNYESFSNVVDVHIKNLRQKLDRGNAPSLLETVRGIGYRLRA